MKLSKSKKKIRFIINPKSGRKKDRYIEDLIYLYLDKSKYEFDIKYTNAPNHASVLSEQATKLKYDIVVAVGGDGTINEVARGLINTDIAMGIIPTGSGDGLARHLNIPRNPKKAIRVINEYNFKFIDSAKINDEIFLGIAGIGFDAHIANKFANSKKRGFFSYASLVIKEHLKYGSKRFDLIIEGKNITKDAFLLSFAKSSQYGNNIIIAPQAKIDDGYLYVVILKYPAKKSYLDILWKLFRGSVDTSKYYETIKCKNIKVIKKT